MNKLKYWIKHQYWKRFPKNTSGFDHRGYSVWMHRIQQPICWLIGHDEAGVYSWISYCSRCYTAFDPIPPNKESEIEEIDEGFYDSYFGGEEE